jgi:hypothetical protein
VKKLTYLCVAFALAAMLGLPAAAQKSHSNSGTTKQTGLARAEGVQNPNGDKVRKGGKKTRTRTRAREGWEKGVAHHKDKAKGHSK